MPDDFTDGDPDTPTKNPFLSGELKSHISKAKESPKNSTTAKRGRGLSQEELLEPLDASEAKEPAFEYLGPTEERLREIMEQYGSAASSASASDSTDQNN
ncbi:hypothetical protein [Weissella viridescens]|uniref:hypothetical protein n=1 Tax=Weissella viridescens TaxID=1629 RepID=UPI003AF208E9